MEGATGHKIQGAVTAAMHGVHGMQHGMGMKA